jgi:serine/threonine protein kinase
MVHADLDYRLRAGDTACVEDYLSRYPQLHGDSSAVIGLVLAEHALRRERGEVLSAAEYVERFPQQQTDLLAGMSTVDESRLVESRQEKEEIILSETALPELDLRSYELIEILGAGGMGEVYRSCDPSLGRNLAIKVIKADYPNHPDGERRFLREARITGSLQHPGIVAVHNLGRLMDGRLHYTMRLVRGQTFADILKQEAGKSKSLPYLLSIFEKICQAVAYAHSKRVIHRDLKPANVMVGKFGEVQVMDWGLAKVLTNVEETNFREPSEKRGTVILSELVDTPSDLSRDGAALGTPAYMPPEQAAGDWSIVDERADVFSLGAILCEILTGQPPYQGDNVKKLLRQARLGDRAEALARLEQSGVDAELTALCRECLAAEREGRPRDAGAVAKRVQEYQAAVQERLRQAELERVAAQTRAREEQARAFVENERTQDRNIRRRCKSGCGKPNWSAWRPRLRRGWPSPAESA